MLSKLEKVVTPEGFLYDVDNSLANDREIEYLPMSDSDHEGNEDEEVEFASGQNELCGCIQKTKSEWLDLLSPECEVLELVSKQ